MKLCSVFFCLFLVPLLLVGQADSSRVKKFQLSGYGSLYYNHYDWQIFPEKRSDIDLERFTIEGEYHLGKKWFFEAELEIEHGGAGATVEFDRFEEFGEFEYEIEKGGEVQLEQLFVEYAFNDKHQLKIGRVKVPFGLYNFQDEPGDYFVVSQPEMESAMLPTAWTELGLSSTHHFGKFVLRTALVNALDGSAFNSANFVRRGNQRRFETVNAEDWAITLRLDRQIGADEEHGFGVSLYGGNTRNNRPKPDLQVDAYLFMADAHAVLGFGPIGFSFLGVWGFLQNSEAVTNANRNLSNNLNVKRTPVASQAIGLSVEASIDLLKLIKKNPKMSWAAFARYDYYDTHFKTEGLVFNNPRWLRQTATVGFNFKPIKQIVFKTQYAYTRLGVDTNANQHTVSAGLGFQF